MEVKVFGPGCSRCEELAKTVEGIVAARGCKSVVTKVSDLKEMMAAGVFSTPALMVNDVLKCTGRVPTQTEIAGWLDEASGGPCTAGTGSGCCCKK